jgi:sortase A
MLAKLEKCLLVVGVCAASYCAYVVGESALVDQYANYRFANALTNAVAEGSDWPAPGDVIGRLEIPRLAVTSIIRAGVDERALRLGVGYIPGTAPPGHAGNMGLAGHRDTWFRALRGITADDNIRVVTTRGTFTYRVVRTRCGCSIRRRNER